MTKQEIVEKAMTLALNYAEWMSQAPHKTVDNHRGCEECLRRESMASAELRAFLEAHIPEYK